MLAILWVVWVSQIGWAADAGTNDTSVAVAEKIQMLGLRDDTLKYQERPLYWLKQRREKNLPQLIAGLDSTQARIGRGCLKVLKGVSESGELLEALIRIGGDANHPINSEATLSLCDFAQDVRAREVLVKALYDEKRFGDARDRATIAESLGKKSEAVRLLVPLLDDKSKSNSKVMGIIRRLGDIGDNSAIGDLTRMSQDRRWRVAVAGYLALAKIDSEKFGLTQDQEGFLVKSVWMSKVNRSTYVEHWKELAEFKRKEVRRYVMQMLDSDSPEAALIVLEMWRDTDALPEIRGGMMMKREGRWHRRAFIAAYLDIEGTDKSIEEVVSMLKKPQDGSGRSGSFRRNDAEEALWGITQSIMSDERKLTVLRRFRDGLDHQLVARHVRGGDEADLSTILVPLMEEENDISALGEYAQTAARDKEKRFGKEVRDALEKLLSKKTISSKEKYGAQLILDACASYGLEDSGKMTDKLLSGQFPANVRIAAARVSAKLGGDRTGALKFLYEQLSSSRREVRQEASTRLSSIKCLGESERKEREELVLSHLGHSSEDYALRVLTTCQGHKTAEKLEPILDEENVARSVYAAWVLAQHPDDAVKEKGLRRVAIYAMFHHQEYQAGAGIDFGIASELSFHQVTSNLRRDWYQPNHGAVKIPKKFLTPFEFDENEEVFAVRAYRYSRLNSWNDMFPPYYLQTNSRGSWDVSHLSLFRVIAHEDPHLGILYVKGEKVAHFTNRKTAARIVSGITNAKASYTGLAGEEIDSEHVPPQPYKDQNKLIAQFVLELIQSTGASDATGGVRHKRREAIERIIRNLTDRLGEDLKHALHLEAKRRDMVDKLKAGRFSIWADWPR